MSGRRPAAAHHPGILDLTFLERSAALKIHPGVAGAVSRALTHPAPPLIRMGFPRAAERELSQLKA